MSPKRQFGQDDFPNGQTVSVEHRRHILEPNIFSCC